MITILKIKFKRPTSYSIVMHFKKNPPSDYSNPERRVGPFTIFFAHLLHSALCFHK